MEDTLFQELLKSVEEAGEIRRGEKEPARGFLYVGSVLIEVKEHGQRVWHISEAAEVLSRKLEEAGVGTEPPDVKTIREALRQSQEGFAELLGISVGMLRGWEHEGAGDEILGFYGKVSGNQGNNKP